MLDIDISKKLTYVLIRIKTERFNQLKGYQQNNSLRFAFLFYFFPTWLMSSFKGIYNGTKVIAMKNFANWQFSCLDSNAIGRHGNRKRNLLVIVILISFLLFLLLLCLFVYRTRKQMKNGMKLTSSLCNYNLLIFISFLQFLLLLWLSC